MNIVEILKYCPKGIKLYSLVDGEVTFEKVENFEDYPIKVILDNLGINHYTKNGLLFDRPNGECVLFPSKDQRDWSKFRLPVKKGDIMMLVDGSYPFIANGIITDNGCYEYICGVIQSSNLLQVSTLNDLTTTWTRKFCIPATKEAKKKLFDKMKEAGYRWNADTLKLEKIEPKFKEGDVIKDNKGNLYLIIATNTYPKIGCVLNQDMKLTILDRDSALASTNFNLASKEERNKLYSALVKEGYKNDKEQHKLVKQEFKPFDKVLVRDDETESWNADIYLKYLDNTYLNYKCTRGNYGICIPYEGNEYLLGTTDSPT